MDFSKSIYWCGVPAVRARSLALASLRLVHDTLAITLSLSHPRSDVHILPVVRGSPTGLRSVPPRPHTLRVTPPLALGLHCPSFRHTPCGGGWAGCTDPLASPGVRRRGRVPRAEGADAPTLPLACTGGGGLDWHGPRGRVGAPSLLSRMRAGRGGARCGGARGAGLVSPAPRRAGLCGAGRTVRPLAYAGRAGRVGLG
ncbi:hypothetical protein EDB83DRAFT_2432192 [Lactarius deliciosus]|nr:hypothetical protein EDB83DRAFT_2432192 [Lactarius deliciosus]